MQTRAPLFSRTPPAVFPPLMGLFGLGLAWRRGAGALGVPGEAAEMLLGAVTLLFLFCLLAYLAKFARRPGVLAEDLRVLPGRAGLAAMSLCLMLLTATLAPYRPAFGEALLYAALALHAALALRLALLLLNGPAEQRRVTPVWHLSFVGFIIAALPAPALELPFVALALLALTAPVAVLVWAASLGQLAQASVPAPLRPLLAIHLAPAALFGIVGHGLGLATVAQGFAALAALILAALVLSGRWLTQAGFSPLWGAFTFPLAATASLWLGLGGVWLLPGIAALLAATVLVPWIAFRVFRLWAEGRLAVVTNAAAA